MKFFETTGRRRPLKISFCPSPGWLVAPGTLLCSIDPRVKKSTNHESSCPGCTTACASSFPILNEIAGIPVFSQEFLDDFQNIL